MIDRKKGMVKIVLDMQYRSTFQSLFEGHIWMPFIDYLCMINVWPKLALHGLLLDDEAFWNLSEGTSLLAVVMLKVVTGEQKEALKDLVKAFPVKDSLKKDTFPQDLMA